MIVETPEGGGPPYVCEIKDTCQIVGWIRLDDRIVALDDDDVRGMSAAGDRSRQAERKIEVRSRETPPHLP